MADAPTTKPELLALIRVRWDALQKLLGQMDEAAMERPLGDGWSAKVHVAHLATWEKSLLGLLRKEDRARAMGIPAELWEGHDTDAINTFLAAEAEPRTVDLVLSEAAATHTEVMALLDSMTQEQLEQPYSHYQPFDPKPNSSPVAGWVHGDTWDHYNEHIGWLEQGLREAN